MPVAGSPAQLSSDSMEMRLMTMQMLPQSDGGHRG